jgi:hypothetical protein
MVVGVGVYFIFCLVVLDSSGWCYLQLRSGFLFFPEKDVDRKAGGWSASDSKIVESGGSVAWTESPSLGV